MWEAGSPVALLDPWVPRATPVLSSSGQVGEGQLLKNTFLQAVGQDAGDRAVPRNAQAACMEVSAMTRMASACALLDSLVPVASRVRRGGART